MGLSVIDRSSVYATEPVDCRAPDWFLNQVVAVRTVLAPAAILAAGQEIERRLGRRPAPRGTPRPMDIDLLLDGSRLIDAPRLSVPHPRLHRRRFVLVPLAEIAPDAVHPRLGRTVADLLRSCDDRSEVRLARLDGEPSLPRRGSAMYHPPRPAGRRGRADRGHTNP